MRIIDAKLLAVFRAGPCAWCGRAGRTHAAHVNTKGMGGWGRADLRVNLVALCCQCHANHHAGHRPIRCDLIALVAAREQLSQAAVEDVLTRLKWGRKEANHAE